MSTAADQVVDGAKFISINAFTAEAAKYAEQIRTELQYL
jgi:hypothetical protein